MACSATGSTVTCGSFNFPATIPGSYVAVLTFMGTNPFTIKMIGVANIFVAPEFPIGAIIAILAPLSGLGLFLVVKKGKLAFLA